MKSDNRIIKAERMAFVEPIATAMNHAIPEGSQHEDVLAALAVALGTGIFEHVAGDRKMYLAHVMLDVATLITMLEEGPSKSGATLG